MNIEKLTTLLADSLGAENITENADMREYTSFKAGGRARLLVRPQSMEQLRYTLYMLGSGGSGGCAGGTDNSSVCAGCSGDCGSERSGCDGCGAFGGGEVTEYVVLGNGTNVLVRDGGYSGVIVQLGHGFGAVAVEDGTMTAEAGALLSVIARLAQREGLTGMEFASGIPGSIGGAAYMNAGAYGGEMAQIITSVQVISRDGTVERLLTADELDYGYRHSALMESGDIVTRVSLTLEKGDADRIEETMRELGRRRNEKQPVSQPSAGSFFKRPEGHFAGALIEQAGLKGLSVGGAQVSPLHAGFIVNTGGASARDIERLMRLVQNTVKEQTGIWLEPEVRIIGEA